MRAAFLVAGVVLLPAIPPAARASITPAAQEIVDRYVEATGGRDALDRERAVHQKATMWEAGLRGSLETWTRVPDRMLVSVSLGTLRVRTGFDGTTAWRTDLSSRKVTVLDGREREGLVADAYFANEMWARRDQGGGRVETHGGTSFAGEESYRTLTVTPPAGSPRRLRFNVRTGLLDRISVEHDLDESVTSYSKPRRLAGRTRPTLEAQADLTLFPDAPHARLDSVRVGESIDSTRFAPPALPERRVAWLGTHGRARIPFRYGTRHVWIRASINGAPPAEFLLDTGASITAIDREYAHLIGLVPEGHMTVEGIAGTDDASFARVGTVQVGGKGAGVALRDFKVALVDLGEGFEAVTWRKPTGLIGYDFLNRFVIELDYDTGQVTFRDPATFTYSGGGEGIAMHLSSGCPTIPVRLDGGCSGEFLVDVGNSLGLLVHGSMVRRCDFIRAVTGRRQVEVVGGGIGGSMVNWLCRLDSIAIGSRRWTEPIAALSLANRGAVGSHEIAGNIGNSVLERFKVTVDYAHHLLYLEPGRRFGERDRHSRSGAMFVRYGERVLAEQIVRGSPADHAGLKPDDRVTAIDGKPILRYSLDELDRLLRDGAVGSRHTVTIDRDGEATTLTLELKDVL